MIRIINASPEFGKSLTEQEVNDFLTYSKLNVHLGTIDDKRYPNIHPTWYYFDSANNKLYVETSKLSKKIDNLRKNKNLYFCIDDPNPPYKGVKGKGICRIHDDVTHNILIAEKIMTKYLGNIQHPMAQKLMSFVKNGDSVILEIILLYFSTWDYSISS
ncbi:MAG TPA: pyridoxamine 5'-phosphate oxidase family protein [Nitrososphaeraceae archaeon]|jgi:nitroimidazol reductase NimA-like FMN-containing flavoprotein (pyridoxamine 5'-phosphate oxidase superfamily)|nr:pyridoxamine 5'-phosphate oxidase family protein [Nitrososphaeraceae archaeon]